MLVQKTPIGNLGINSIFILDPSQPAVPLTHIQVRDRSRCSPHKRRALYHTAPNLSINATHFIHSLLAYWACLSIHTMQYKKTYVIKLDEFPSNSQVNLQLIGRQVSKREIQGRRKAKQSAQIHAPLALTELFVNPKELISSYVLFL